MKRSLELFSDCTSSLKADWIKKGLLEIAIDPILLLFLLKKEAIQGTFFVQGNPGFST